MKRIKTGIMLLIFALLAGCAHDKYPLPSIPTGEDLYGNTGKKVYNLVIPVLDAAHGYTFNKPSDIYVGVDNFLYLCDTGNNRIVMMDLGGTIQGYSQFIEQPEAITQNDSLALLVVNKTNKVYKIDMVAANHNIAQAPIQLVYEQTSEPTRQFTGISVHNGFEYYVSVIDVADTSTNYLESSFIYDFKSNNALKGKLPLYVNGTGLYSAIIPTAVISMRERYLDVSSGSEDTPAFIFTQVGRTSLLYNAFKFQSVTTTIFEGQEVLIPNTGLIGSDIYSTSRFWNLQDVAIDRQGYIFLLEGGGSDIAAGDTTQYMPGFYRFTSSGTELQEVLAFGSAPKQFKNPKGIAVTPFEEEQTVFVSDTGNDRVMMFQLSTQQ